MKTLLSSCAAIVVALIVYNPMVYGHWPDQPPHQIAELGEFTLEGGGVINNLRMSFVTHGKLNADKSNAILFMHGFGLNHHQFDHMIGPGKALDTHLYFIICPDSLGNSQPNFQHSTSPTNSGMRMQFPFYNGRDRVKAEHKLVTEFLGIPHLLAVTGISTGADHSVQMAVSYPSFMDGIFPVSGGALWGSVGYFYSFLLESVIESCAGWNNGNYDNNPGRCAANALSVLVPSFYTREWWEQNTDTPEAFQKWRSTWGDYYFDIQDARDLYYQSKASSLGWVGDTPGFGGDLNAALGSIKAKALFIYSPNDQNFLPQHIDSQVKAIAGSRAAAIDSPAGHLICCNADPNATRIIGEIIKQFLTELRASSQASQ